MPKTLPPSTVEPFTYEGSRGSVLLLHGFTGSPYVMRTIGQALFEVGFASHAPLLPGHGATPEILRDATAESWIHAASKAFLDLPGDKPRIVIGLSMGALLATLLARDFAPQIDKLVLLAPAFRLKLYGRTGVWLARNGFFQNTLLKKASAGGDVLDEEASTKNPNCPKTPFKALAEFDKIAQRANKAIDKIQCPTLAMFGLKDRTVDSKKTAKILEAKVTSPLTITNFANSAHVLPLDLERDELIAQILDFCEERP